MSYGREVAPLTAILSDQSGGEAAAREKALLAALNGSPRAPKLGPPPLRRPVLSDDFAERLAALDEKIYERGVAVEREKLLSLGEARFQELLTADRCARTEQRVITTRTDLTSWPSVFHALVNTGALSQVSVPARKTYEQLYGINQELDQIRQVDGFVDVWKLFRAVPRAVRAIRAFRDVFESLVFGQSFFVWIDTDNRVHHKFFCGGSGNKVRLFNNWLPALKGAHYRVTLHDSLAAVVFWLAREKGEPPDVLDLAREYSNKRVPSEKEIRFAQAVLDGFVLNYKGWALWQFVGRETQALLDERLLEVYREQLEKRFRRIQFFHREVERSFLHPVGDHLQLDSAKHRAFINRTVKRLCDCVSVLAALAVEENSPSTIAARFQDQIVCAGKPKAQLRESISEKLSAGFPRATFKLQIEA